jgi:hypothetical protein
MKKTITLLTIFLIISFHSKAQINLNDFDDAEIYFNGIFEDNSQIDEYGNILIDKGSASAGRLMFRITDVNLKMEEKPEEPGCADICPPRIIIHFECRKSECILDPAFDMENFQSGSITILDVKKGKKAFEFLKAYKEFIQKN